MPQCPRTSPSRRLASASSLCRLVIPYTTSTVVPPLTVRSRVSSNPCASPAQSWCLVSIVVVRSVLTSRRPCPLSTLRPTVPSGGGGPAWGGKGAPQPPRLVLERQPRRYVHGQGR